MKIPRSVRSLFLLAALAASALAADKPGEPKAVKPYPLKVCLVQDDKLDDKPFVFIHQGREIKLCCDGCKPDFDKSPAKFMQKLEAAEKKLK